MRKRKGGRYTGKMPAPPPEKLAVGRASNPARIMLNSPLAAAMRARVYHQRTRSRPPERGVRVLAMVGALLVHLLFLFAFVLGPAYPLQPRTPAKQQFLQVRLIEPPEPPLPPPVRGNPPREKGPAHQGHASRPVTVSERRANIQAPSPPAAPALVAAVTPPQPAPKPAQRLPRTVPAPIAKPKGTPPRVRPVPAQPTPIATAQPPAPPKFQPESIRKPQAEGNQPMPPPTSLVMPKLALPSPPSDVPRMAPLVEAPSNSASLSVTPPPSVTPPVPTSPPVPLPAPPSPRMNLQADLMAPVPIAAPALPPSKASAAPLGKVELQLAAMPAPAPVQVPPEPPQKIQALAAATLPAMQPAVKPAVMHPAVSAPTTVAALAPAAPRPPAEAPLPATASVSPPSRQAAPAGAGAPDVSRAPDASAQGSDAATPGQVNGVLAAPSTVSSPVSAAVLSSSGQGQKQGQGEKLQGTGQPGGNQPGTEHGEKHGALGDYVQLRPQGDTRIMNHGAPNIGYQATRFEKDWTPENESSVDTALRRAVEKTTVKHTFHLPQGIRVECAVMPLLPMSLFGCRNPDPPPKPVADKVYDPLHLPPANPVAAPTPATSTPTAAASAPATVTFDNSAECAAARVAGGPAPPGCAPIALPVNPLRGPASSSSSWVPASDQFH